MDKKVYYYHPETKEYLGDGLAVESPLEPGVFHIPASATDIKPPNAKKGKQIVFENSGWVYQDAPEKPQSVSNSQLTKEARLNEIRVQRDTKLRNCDWTQLPDAPISKELKDAYGKYRQKLRDFPKSCDPSNPKWPEEPV